MNLNLTTATRYGLNVLALLGGSLALYFGKTVFIPLTIAALLAAIMYPYARALNHRFRVPWFFACLGVVSFLIFLVALVFLLVGLAIPQMVNDLPSDEAKQRQMFENIRSKVVSSIPFAGSEKLLANDNDAGFYYLRKFFTGDYINNSLIDIGKLSGFLIYQAVLVLFILLFLLIEGQMLVNKVRNIFGPAAGVQRQVTETIGEMAVAVRSYLVWRTLVNFGLGLALGGIYHAIGLKQATLWGVLTFILCYVPYIGTIAAGVPPILEALILPTLGPGPALGILIFYTAVVTFEGYIIVPRVMGRSMDLNATTVLLACLYWDLVWGTAGLFLAMPLMAAVKAVCLHVEGWSAWGHLMSSEETPITEPAPEQPKTASVLDIGKTPRNG